MKTIATVLVKLRAKTPAGAEVRTGNTCQLGSERRPRPGAGSRLRPRSEQGPSPRPRPRPKPRPSRALSFGGRVKATIDADTTLIAIAIAIAMATIVTTAIAAGTRAEEIPTARTETTASAMRATARIATRATAAFRTTICTISPHERHEQSWAQQLGAWCDLPAEPSSARRSVVHLTSRQTLLREDSDPESGERAGSTPSRPE